MIPEQIGRYQIKEGLGRGGMSVVYRAYDPLFERDVTLKLMALDLLDRPDFRTRFVQEAKTIAALDHPAIVPVYDLGEAAGQPYFVMRYMPDGSLADRLTKGPLPLTEAASILKRLAPALDEAHTQGIIHRDLKPSNVLFDQRQEAFIADFGIAKLSEGSQNLTQTGAMVGTPAYMSPEQIQGDGAIDGRSDIYALGIMLFEMLTGHHPYQTDTPIAVAVKHISEPVPRLAEVAPELPTGCQKILDKAMAKDREARYPTAVLLAEAVQALVDGPADKPVARPTTRWTTAVSGYVWLLPILLLGLFLLALQGNGHTPLTSHAANGEASQTAVALLSLATSTATATPTPVSPPPTLEPTMTKTAVFIPPTATQTHTPSPTPTATRALTTTALVHQSASLFAQPDVDSVELGFVDEGEEVEIIGRAPAGQWLYVLSAEGIVGYVFAPRFDWNGRFDDLPIIDPDSLADTSSSCPNGPCPRLQFDLYALPGSRCEGENVYRTIYMLGRGGDGSYIYYWNGQRLAGPTSDGFGFEVLSVNGGPVIGNGRIVSGDGQRIERDLFVTNFTCE